MSVDSSWVNPFAEDDGQVHDKAPNQQLGGNIMWRLDSADTQIYIIESCGEFYWRYDHKDRTLRLDSENHTPGWNLMLQGDSVWHPLVLGEEYILPRTQSRHFRPDSAGVGYLFFTTTPIPVDTTQYGVGPGGFPLQDSV